MAVLRKTITLKKPKIEHSAGVVFIFKESSFQISYDTPSKPVRLDRAEWCMRLSSQGSYLNFITALRKLNAFYIIPSFMIYLTLV